VTTRTVVTRAQLSALITERVQKIEDMIGTTVSVSYKLADPPAGAPNWSDYVVSPGPSVTADQAAAAVRTVVVREFLPVYDVSD
jgi:hypothetical protein